MPPDGGHSLSGRLLCFVPGGGMVAMARGGQHGICIAHCRQRLSEPNDVMSVYGLPLIASSRHFGARADCTRISGL